MRQAQVEVTGRAADGSLCEGWRAAWFAVSVTVEAPAPRVDVLAQAAAEVLRLIGVEGVTSPAPPAWRTPSPAAVRQEQRTVSGMLTAGLEAVSVPVLVEAGPDPASAPRPQPAARGPAVCSECGERIEHAMGSVRYHTGCAQIARTRQKREAARRRRERERQGDSAGQT